MTTSDAPQPMFTCDLPEKWIQVSKLRSLHVQDSVNTEKPEVVLASSLVESSRVEDSVRRLCVNRRKEKCFYLHSKPSGTALAQNAQEPLNQGGHTASSTNTSLSKHFDRGDTKHSTATNLSDHEIHRKRMLCRIWVGMNLCDVTPRLKLMNERHGRNAAALLSVCCAGQGISD